MTVVSKGFFRNLRNGLSRTREEIVRRIESAVQRRGGIDEDLFEELEETLLEADIGVRVVQEILDAVRKEAGSAPVNDAGMVLEVVRNRFAEILGEASEGLRLAENGLSVVMFVGVNGTGKTTSLGKLAWILKAGGKRVLIAAADTFRAAAGEQAEIWARRSQAEIVRGAEGADPSAVVFDAVQAARARNIDVVLIDTAGRLHTKTNLMEELKKIARIAAREVEGAPHEILLVLDATTGQNALRQAELFTREVGVTGLVLTKLDGTAKGGIVIAIKDALRIPVKYVGLGEGIESLEEFKPAEFAEALLER